MTQDKTRKAALRNLLRAFDMGSNLPNQVFQGSWSSFLFFESDRVFAPEFTDVIKELLRAEGGEVACLLNLDETSSFEFEEIAAIFLDATTTSSSYESVLDGTGPATGWIYRMDNYVCSSDVGEWGIYCEKGNDVAVIGLHEAGNIKKFEMPLTRLLAKPIGELIDEGSSSVFPFNKLVPAWRHGLAQNYRR